jgi:hypothetical protein
MLLSILLGGITHHYIAPNLNYCNTINDSGTIKHEYVIAMVGDNDAKIGVIKGKDSACGDIFGGIAALSLTDNLDFMLGGYNTNFKKFEERGIVPPSFSGVTPVFGLNFKIPLYKSGDTKVSIDNLISFGIITHALNFTF